MPCGAACPGDWTNWEFNPDAAYQGTYDPRQQAANRARAKQAASLVIDLGSVAGDVKGLIEVFTGRDLVTGEDLGNWRFAGLAGLVGLGEIRYLRFSYDVLELGVPIGKRLGDWMKPTTENMSAAARAYQAFVTGAVPGYVFARNGYNFDGIRLSSAGEAILLDAKSGADFYRKVGDLPFLEQRILDDAYKQLEAADGLQIQWHIQDYATWEALRDFFQQKGISIDVVWTQGP
jgi:hypothetical protein